MHAHFVPFTVQTRMSGVDIDGTQIRKGAPESVIALLKQRGLPETRPEIIEAKTIADGIVKKGGTPLAVVKNDRLLGVIHLKDVVMGGIRERFAQLRRMGIRTIMITGDNPLTAAAIAAVVQVKPDLMILDLGLPDQDGLDVIRQVRAQSAAHRGAVGAQRRAGQGRGSRRRRRRLHGETIRRRGAAGAGAHRAAPPLQQQGLGPVFRLHDLSLDFMAHRVTVGGAEVKLSKREFELLRLLAEHAGKVMIHRQILTAVWGEAHRDDVEYLRVYVRQLRSKLGDDPAAPRFIETEPELDEGAAPIGASAQ